jgi:uncharacterized membrane protein YeaQ/YmgE (transglycosylase-associated protein family)
MNSCGFESIRDPAPFAQAAVWADAVDDVLNFFVHTACTPMNRDGRAGSSARSVQCGKRSLGLASYGKRRTRRRTGMQWKRNPLRRSLMGIIIWLVIGGIVGWLASIVMKRDGSQGIIMNVIVGIVGALLGGFLISPLVGVGTINGGISIGSILVSLVGAIILLAIVNLFKRGTVR